MTDEGCIVATTEAQIAACWEVLHALRPDVSQSEFVDRVRAQQDDGYQLVYIADGQGPVAAAGFRIGRNLAWGRFLYVDDLVTRPSARSQGHGATLLRWLHDLARAEGCAQLHLDSGAQRLDAHRFYEREGMQNTGSHFVSRLV